MNAKSFHLFLIILCCTGFLQAQTTFNWSLSKKSVMVGEPFEIYVTWEYANNDSVNRISLQPLSASFNTLYQKDSVDFEPYADLEILHSSPWDNFTLPEEFSLQNMAKKEKNGRFLLENTFTCAIYNPGIFILSAPTVNDTPVKASSDLIIEVTVPETDSIQPLTSPSLYPIKPIDEEPFHWTDLLPLFYTVMLLILIVLLYKYWIKKPKAEVPQPKFEVKETPFEMAMRKLNETKIESYANQIDAKTYFTRLTFILREYLENRFGIPALEMSSSECLDTFRQRGIFSGRLENTLSNLLNLADLVKFAKADGNTKTPENLWQEVKNFIQEIDKEI